MQLVMRTSHCPWHQRQPQISRLQVLRRQWRQLVELHKVKHPRRYFIRAVTEIARLASKQMLRKSDFKVAIAHPTARLIMDLDHLLPAIGTCPEPVRCLRDR